MFLFLQGPPQQSGGYPGQPGYPNEPCYPPQPGYPSQPGYPQQPGYPPQAGPYSPQVPSGYGPPCTQQPGKTDSCFH